MKQTTGLILALFFALPPVSQASQVFSERPEEMGASIAAVLRVNISDARKSIKRMTLKDGSEGPITSFHWTYECVVVESVYGPWDADTRKTATLEYSMSVPVVYDEDGKEKFHFSYSSPTSGIEHDLKLGQEYLVSLVHVDEAGKPQALMRADSLDHRNGLLAGIYRGKAWALLERGHADLLPKIQVASFDPVLKLLGIIVLEGDTRWLYLVDPVKSEIRRLKTGADAFNQLYFDPDMSSVVLRRNLERPWQYQLDSGQFESVLPR